jgi:hypothetical protein
LPEVDFLSETVIKHIGKLEQVIAPAAELNGAMAESVRCVKLRARNAVPGAAGTP